MREQFGRDISEEQVLTEPRSDADHKEIVVACSHSPQDLRTYGAIRVNLTPNIDTIGLAHAYNVADNCVRTALRSGRRIDLVPQRTRRLVSSNHVQRGDRPLGGLRQRDCDLRTVPREECAGDRDKNVERPTWPLLTIRSAGNGNPKRAAECGGT